MAQGSGPQPLQWGHSCALASLSQGEDTGSTSDGKTRKLDSAALAGAKERLMGTGCPGQKGVALLPPPALLTLSLAPPLGRS